MMKFSPLLPLRVFQLLLAITVLALSSYIADWYRSVTTTASPAEINFLIAAPILTLLTLAYLEGVGRFFPRACHPYAALGLEALNVIFYLAGFVALAVFLARLLFCRGPVCGAARADVALAATSFLAWVASAVLLAIDLFRGSGSSASSGRRRGSPPPVQHPEMSQPQSSA